jgi:hypothetical protein
MAIARRRPGMTAGVREYRVMVCFTETLIGYLKSLGKTIRLLLATTILVLDELRWVACG